MTAASDAFCTQLREVHGVEDADAIAIQPGPSEMDVPGFVTYQVMVDGYPVRGWANDQGAVVMFARQNFGLILDAVKFAAEPPGMVARDVVERLVWSHGPAYELVEHVAAGELGLDADVTVPVHRHRTSHGNVQLLFAVRRRRDGVPVTILHYTISGSETRPFEVGLRQLAPKVANPDEDDE